MISVASASEASRITTRTGRDALQLRWSVVAISAGGTAAASPSRRMSTMTPRRSHSVLDATNASRISSVMWLRASNERPSGCLGSNSVPQNPNTAHHSNIPPTSSTTRAMNAPNQPQGRESIASAQRPPARTALPLMAAGYRTGSECEGSAQRRRPLPHQGSGAKTSKICVSRKSWLSSNR